MKSIVKLALLSVFVVSGATSAFATYYTNEATFVAAINPSYYLEDFNGWTFGNPLNGSQTTWAAPGGNGYGWTAGTVNGLGLYSNISALSTNNANDPLTFTFSGNPVMAFGGYFCNSDISGNVIPGDVTLSFSDGSTQTLTNVLNGTTFFGYTGNVALVSAQVGVTSSATNNWPQADHIYTGTTAAVPEPATFLAIGAGVAALAISRRRKSA